MKKVFVSGSCRVLIPAASYTGFSPIHAMKDEFNFLVKLHTTRQHLQFIRVAANLYDIPEDDLPFVFTSFDHCRRKQTDRATATASLKSIRAQWSEVEVILLEVCSVKDTLVEDSNLVYTPALLEDVEDSGLPNTQPYRKEMATQDSMLKDILAMKEIIGQTPLILLCHLDPQIWGGPRVESRELIRETCDLASTTIENVYFLDPNRILQEHGRDALTDDVHWSFLGQTSFQKLLQKMFDFLETGSWKDTLV